MAEYNLSVNTILNILLERAFYICSFLYKVPFAYQFKTIENNIKQFSINLIAI